MVSTKKCAVEVLVRGAHEQIIEGLMALTEDQLREGLEWSRANHGKLDVGVSVNCGGLHETRVKAGHDADPSRWCLLVACLISASLLLHGSGTCDGKRPPIEHRCWLERGVSLCCFGTSMKSSFSAAMVDTIPRQPVALVLNYLRSVSGRDIAEASIDEIRNRGVFDTGTDCRLAGSSSPNCFQISPEGDRFGW